MTFSPGGTSAAPALLRSFRELTFDVDAVLDCAGDSLPSGYFWRLYRSVRCNLAALQVSAL